MLKEIERKHLVISEAWRRSAGVCHGFRQGYLARSATSTVRVRRSAREATLSVKSPRRGVSRMEVNCSISLSDADYLLRRLCIAPIIYKVRHEVIHDGMIWSVDVYGGSARGLVMAEIELNRPDQSYQLPDWAGVEVTGDPHYSNWAIATGAGIAPRSFQSELEGGLYAPIELDPEPRGQASGTSSPGPYPGSSFFQG